MTLNAGPEVLAESTPPQVPVRRATDVVRGVAAAGLLTLVSVTVAQGAFSPDAWQLFVGELPAWVVQASVTVVVIAFVIALALTLSSLLKLRSEANYPRDLAVAWTATIVAAWAISLLVVDSGIESGALDPERTDLLAFPDVVVAIVAAVVVVASAHVARPNRPMLWWLLAAATAAATVTDPSALMPVAGGLGLGLAVGSGWLALAGSPAGLPEVATVRAGLARRGIQADSLVMLPAPAWAGAVICMVESAGREVPLRVKVFGRDAVTADFWVRLGRRVTYLDDQRSWSGQGIDSVEHEGVVTDEAALRGVPVARVVAISDWAEKDPFVAIEWRGRGISEVPVEEVDAATEARAWSALTTLHEAGIVHGALDGTSVRIDDGAVLLADFERGRFTDDQRLRDRDCSNLLVLLGSLLGAERAVAGAIKSLGARRVNDLASYLEPAAIRMPLVDGRQALKQLLAALREAISTSTEMPLPPPAVLKRMSWQRLLLMALVILAVSALADSLAGIDFAAVAAEMADAKWALVLVALLVGQLILIPEALATTSLVPERLPFGPLIALQSAMRFLGLAVPGPAARVAANTAFLRKQGISVPRSLTLGVLDSTAGLLVELLILVLAFLVGDLSTALFGAEPPDVNWAVIAVLLVIGLIVIVLLLRFVTKIRERAVSTWHSVWDALSVLRESPIRGLALFSANLVARLVSACALWLVLASLGVQLDLLAVLVVIAASNLLSGLIPIPGNVGIAEAALTFFLIAAGVDPDTAFAAAVVYRIVTAYIPPFWGAYAQRWLARNDYL